MLIPLSRARARAVLRALADLGIPAGRMEALGMGGTTPVVSFKYKKLQWKNRRVEIVLTKS